MVLSLLGQQPCEHILQAARKAAVDPGTLIWEHETLETCRAQYANLPEFLVPTSVDMQHLTPDAGILECLVKPFGKGRVGPNTRRLKGPQDFLLKLSKRINESALQQQNRNKKKKRNTTEQEVAVNDTENGTEDEEEVAVNDTENGTEDEEEVPVNSSPLFSDTECSDFD